MFAQQGVNFEDITLSQALKKAGAEGKLVFVDGYTSWCGPCRWMSEEQFTLPEAGAFFNERFVNVKFDLEKGDGVDIAKRYDIKAYPTFLILRPDSTLQHVIVGCDTLHLFIPMVERGLNEKSSLHYLEGRRSEGNMTKGEMADAIVAYLDAYRKDEAQALAEELFGRLTDQEKLTKDYWVVFETITYDQLLSPRYRYVVENYRRFADDIPQEGREKVVRTMLTDHLYNHTNGAITKGNNFYMPEVPDELSVIRDYLTTYPLEDKPFLTAWTELAQAVLDGEVDRYQPLFDRVAAFPQFKEYDRHFSYFMEKFMQ